MTTERMLWLARDLTSGNDDDKIRALKEIRQLVSTGETDDFFDLVRRQVSSANTDVRWQSLVVIGEYIRLRNHNEEIWKLLLEHCDVDEDMRDALASILLEHLLQYDFDLTLDRIRTGLVSGVPNLLDVVQRCWRFGQSEVAWARFQELITAFSSDP